MNEKVNCVIKEKNQLSSLTNSVMSRALTPWPVICLFFFWCPALFAGSTNALLAWSYFFESSSFFPDFAAPFLILWFMLSNYSLINLMFFCTLVMTTKKSFKTHNILTLKFTLRSLCPLLIMINRLHFFSYVLQILLHFYPILLVFRLYFNWYDFCKVLPLPHLLFLFLFLL